MEINGDRTWSVEREPNQRRRGALEARARPIVLRSAAWAPDEGAHQWCDDQHAIKVGTPNLLMREVITGDQHAIKVGTPNLLMRELISGVISMQSRWALKSGAGVARRVEHLHGGWSTADGWPHSTERRPERRRRQRH
jgi:hypothetical protein